MSDRSSGKEKQYTKCFSKISSMVVGDKYYKGNPWIWGQGT